MFDHFSHDMLTDHDDYSHAQHYDANNQIDDFAQHVGMDTIQHFDADHQFIGSDHLLGHDVLHYDSTGLFEGHSSLMGDTLMHYDSNNLFQGSDVEVAGTTMHYAADGHLVGKTDASGTDYDAMGMVTGRFNKIFH